MRSTISFVLLAAALLFFSPAVHAYNFSWSTHEDITRNDPDNDPGECSNCQCEGPPDKCNLAGSPVYLKTGHLTWEETDISLPGRPALRLVRNYSSHDPRTGLFGNGWISTFERALVKTTKTLSRDDGSSYRQTYFVFRHPSGRRYTFKELEDGSFETPRGLFQKIDYNVDGSYTFHYPDGSLEVYEEGRMAVQADANGNTLTLSYNAEGMLETVENTGGSRLSFYYDANGFVGAVSDHTGRTWNYSYDADGNLAEIIDPLGGRRSFSYASHKPQGDAQVYYQLTNITDATGISVIDVAYAGERVTSYSEGQNSFSYSYDTANRSAVKTDSTGSRYGYNWDENGLITRKVEPLGKALTILRNDDLVRTGKVDRAGQRWSWEKDERGRVTSSTTPLDQRTAYSYAGENPYPANVTTPLGHTTSMAYDEAYNLTSVTNALGDTTSLSYDSRGNVTALSDPQGRTVSLTYNTFSLPTTLTDQLGRTTTYAYDELGRRVAVTDAEGRTSRFEYDELSRLVRSTNPLGHVIEYSYDAAGRLLTLTDPAGNTTSYEYDGYGRLRQEVQADGRTTTYTYNSDNTVASVTRPGATVSYAYDAAKHLVREDVGGDVTTYSYDARGLLTGAANGEATIGLAFDAAGRLTGETLNGLAVARSYDADDNLTGLAYADEGLPRIPHEHRFNLASAYYWQGIWRRSTLLNFHNVHQRSVQAAPSSSVFWQ